MKYKYLICFILSFVQFGCTIVVKCNCKQQEEKVNTYLPYIPHNVDTSYPLMGVPYKSIGL